MASWADGVAALLARRALLPSLLPSRERNVPEGDSAGPLRFPQLECAGAGELPRLPFGSHHDKAQGAGGKADSCHAER